MQSRLYVMLWSLRIMRMCNQSSCARACATCRSNWWISWRACNEDAPLPNIFSAVFRDMLPPHLLSEKCCYLLFISTCARTFFQGPWAVPCFEEERLCFNLIYAAIFVLVSLWPSAAMMGTQRVEKYTKIHTSSHLLLCLFIGGALNQAGRQLLGAVWAGTFFVRKIRCV